MSHFRTVLTALVLLAFGGGVGCDMPSGPGCACTEQFVFLIVSVRDAAGQPVSGVGITVTQVRTGDVLAVQQGGTQAGTYVILDDTFRTKIISVGETIRVVGSKGTASFTQEFVVKTDSCGCHVAKVSGPSSITL